MSRTFSFQCRVVQSLADTITPVSIYLRLRDLFPCSILLESADYKPHERCFSYICCHPVASFRVQDEEIHQSFPDHTQSTTPISSRHDVSLALKQFSQQFQAHIDPAFDFLNNGLFGFVSYDAIRYFEDLEISQPPALAIPDIHYNVFRYIIAIDHYKNELFLLENQLDLPDAPASDEPDLETLAYLIAHKDFPSYSFHLQGAETSNFSDDEYIEAVEFCKRHIARGDIFQIVPSRKFSQSFLGDEFNVYRALRSINPSPYLFYFDYGSFKIFGSSPEAQLVVQDQQASLYPIAGTYKRTGDQNADLQAAEALKEDPKENAEHVMLVDLARNDLSKHCENVHVAAFKEIQLYSHVIHLTSRVSGTLMPQADAIDMLGDTFPMGTLSGAPKHRAMQLLDEVERGRRGPYGGAIGCLGFDGSCNHAIIIRSFVSQQNSLHCQAGGGVVADSIPENERQEVNNKLRALKHALSMAQEIGSF